MKPREFLENLGVSPAATEGTEYLRKMVLALAVRGSLVPQVHAEGTGHDLLSRIRAVAQKAGNVHKARQEEADPSEVAQPFQIPAHWVWACWRDLILSSEAGWSPQCASRPRSGDEWGVLKVSAVSWDRFDPDQNKALLPGVEPRRDCAVRAGDFIRGFVVHEPAQAFQDDAVHGDGLGTQVAGFAVGQEGLCGVLQGLRALADTDCD